MSLIRLTMSNFKRNLRNYMSLVLALAFSVFVFFNFQCVLYSDSMEVLNNYNKDYIDLIVHALSVVFGVFLFFFIWYATNVFLNQRKKEIGIYIFMGLGNKRIGKMYALEALFSGLFSLAAGLAAGVVFSKLFQMVLLRISEISVDIKFSFSLKPVLITACVFMPIYGLMVVKGYVSLVRSSVLDMLSGAKQKEMKAELAFLTAIKIILGVSVLGAGYYCAVRTGDIDSLAYALAAVILVIAGTYFIYGGLIPWLVRRLTENKQYLYQKQRNLWVNNLAFRLKRNYRTYAIVTVLMICSVTALGTSIALKQRYERSEHFRTTYTCQMVTKTEVDADEIQKGIEKENKVKYRSSIPLLALDPEKLQSKYKSANYAITSESAVKAAAGEAGLPYEHGKLGDNECIHLTHIMLLSFTPEDNERVTIGDQEFQQIAESNVPYLGDLQNGLSVYVVNDAQYKKLLPLGAVMYLYNYKFEDPENLDASVPYLRSLAKEDQDRFVGVNLIRTEDKEGAWVRVMYSLCVFMFATLILACGSIIFIKLNNEAAEDMERYRVLQKIGIQKSTLYKSMKNEIRFTYYCPFVLMVLTSYFSIHAVGTAMKEDLLRINVFSAAAILLLFSIIYLISVRTFRRKVLD